MIKFHVSTAIRIAVSTHVAEILRDAGPEVAFRYFVFLRAPVDFMVAQGLHAREIAKPTGVHPAKLCKYRGSGHCVSLMVMCHQLESFVSLQQITYSLRSHRMCSPTTVCPQFWTRENLLKG